MQRSFVQPASAHRLSFRFASTGVLRLGGGGVVDRARGCQNDEAATEAIEKAAVEVDEL